MQEVPRDMLLLSTGSVRERQHCLSVRSSIVPLTQNDSVDLAQNLRPTLLSPMCTNASQSYVNGCSIFQKKTHRLIPVPPQLVLFLLCSESPSTTINATAVTHHDVRVSSAQTTSHKTCFNTTG